MSYNESELYTSILIYFVEINLSHDAMKLNDHFYVIIFIKQEDR